MENASKAILIAGAILLTMAIIGVGMVIFSKAGGAVGEMGNDISGFSVTAHNNKFNMYVGKVTGSQVLECAQKALTTNQNENIQSQFKVVRVTLDGADMVKSTSTSYTTPANFNINKKYNGSISYDGNGIINLIAFTS